MRNLLTLPSQSKAELHPLKAFLSDFPDAEYDGDRLVAYTEDGDIIDFLTNLQYHIEDYLENSPLNYAELSGIEIVDNAGGHKIALEEIISGNY